MNYQNKQVARVALITGAARRIGAAIAQRLHRAGFRVAIHCNRSHAAAVRLCQQLNALQANSAQVFLADLTRVHEHSTLMTQIVNWGGRLDLLVNNASVFMKTDLESLDEAQWDTLWTMNVKAPFWLSVAARPYLAVYQGAIVNITDIHAQTPLKGYSEYCQTKAALLLQTKSLAREFAPQIRVNAVAPGAIAWPEEGNALTIEQQQAIVEKTWLKRHGDADAIAQAVLALAENSFITGQSLRVDGGR